MIKLTDISQLSVGLTVIDTENEDKSVEIIGLTSSTVCVSLLRDERNYSIKAKCDKCNREATLKKDQSKKCQNKVYDIIQVSEHEYKVVKGKMIEQRKKYFGVNCTQWYAFDNFLKRFETQEQYKSRLANEKSFDI